MFRIKIIAKFAVCHFNRKMNYFQFLFRSSNQHGVHSPFVFNYLTKGLYRPYRNTYSRKKHFIEQTIQYFQPDNIVDFRTEKTTDLPETIDLVIIRSNQLETSDFLNFIDSFHNDTTGIIDCRNLAEKRLAEKLLQHPKITVVLHFYWYIVFFVRKEQQKELFFLRL